MACNTSLWALLGLTGGRIGPDPINWLVMSSPRTYICYSDRTFKSVRVAVPNPYLLSVRRRWLRVNCVENWNLTRAENLKLATARKPTFNLGMQVAYSPSQPKRMGYPLDLFPAQVGFRGWWWSEKYTAYMGSSNKKSKWNLSESNSENEAADLPRFIVIESLEEVCLAKFSPLLIEKVRSTKASPRTVKKTRNGNFIVEVDNRRQPENIFFLKSFIRRNAERTSMRNSILPRELSGVES